MVQMALRHRWGVSGWFLKVRSRFQDTVLRSQSPLRGSLFFLLCETPAVSVQACLRVTSPISSDPNRRPRRNRYQEAHPLIEVFTDAHETDLVTGSEATKRLFLFTTQEPMTRAAIDSHGVRPRGSGGAAPRSSVIVGGSETPVSFAGCMARGLHHNRCATSRDVTSTSLTSAAFSDRAPTRVVPQLLRRGRGASAGSSPQQGEGHAATIAKRPKLRRLLRATAHHVMDARRINTWL